MQTWGRLASADEARTAFRAAWSNYPRKEWIATADAYARVLAREVVSPEDLPAFRRSLMDGFACRSEDIRSVPVVLKLVGDVEMGADAALTVRSGQTVRVPTGGAVPEGADVVVPIEQAEEVPNGVEIQAALTAGRHLIEVGEDVKDGDSLLPAGRRLRAPDIGALMGLGLTRVEVYARPIVAILATGDEIIPPDACPSGSQVRNVNTYSLSAAVHAAGAIPRLEGIVHDDEDAQLQAARTALRHSDVLIISAGSSVGAKDLATRVIQQLGQPGVLVHGVNIRPGKPTVLAVCDGKPVFGLPGQPVSVLNTFDQFVAPILREMQRLSVMPPEFSARLTEALRSADGREDHVRVRLELREGARWVTPIHGVSSMISTMTRADGIVVIPAGSPGYEANEEVSVRGIE